MTFRHMAYFISHPLGGNSVVRGRCLHHSSVCYSVINHSFTEFKLFESVTRLCTVYCVLWLHRGDSAEAETGSGSAAWARAVVTLVFARATGEREGGGGGEEGGRERERGGGGYPVEE